MEAAGQIPSPADTHRRHHVRQGSLLFLPNIVVLLLILGGAAFVTGIVHTPSGGAEMAQAASATGSVVRGEGQVLYFSRRRHQVIAVPASNTLFTPAPVQTRREIQSQQGKGFLKILQWLRGSGAVKQAPTPQPAPAASSGSSIPVPATSPSPVSRMGVFLTQGSVGRKDGFYDRTLQRIEDTGGNAVVFDAKGSFVFFGTGAAMADKLGLSQKDYDLPEVIRKAHEKGIYTIARFISVKDYGLTSALPQTLIRHPSAGYPLSTTWVDPSNPTALQYNSEILCQLAKAGVDEINMDYIRFSTENPKALSVFSAKDKADRVETFVRMARETINQCGSGTLLGMSTYAILGWNYDVNVETLGQDVVRFAPYVDIISPMAYPATFTSPEYYNPEKNTGSRAYSLVYRTLTGYQKLLGREESKKLRPWIQAYSFTSKDIQDEIKAVYDANLCGFQFWNANNNYDPAYAALKASGSMRPEGCL